MPENHFTVRILAYRDIREEADVVIHVPNSLKLSDESTWRDERRFEDYITEKVFDIASERGAWENMGVDSQGWVISEEDQE